MDILSDTKLRTKIRGALRKIWRDTRSREYINLVRTPYQGEGRYQYGVKCEMLGCGKIMGLSQREHLPLKKGGFTKKPKIVYEVDHMESNHEFLGLKDLGEFALTLFNGKLRILCHECHKERTKRQELHGKKKRKVSK